MVDLERLLARSLLGRSALIRLETRAHTSAVEWADVVWCLNAAIADDLREYSAGSSDRRQRARMPSLARDELAADIAGRFRSEITGTDSETLTVFVDLDAPDLDWVHAFRRSSLSPNIHEAIERSGKRLLRIECKPARWPTPVRSESDLRGIADVAKTRERRLRVGDLLDLDAESPMLGTEYYEVVLGQEMDLSWEAVLRLAHQFVSYRSGHTSIAFTMPASVTYQLPFVDEINAVDVVDQGPEHGGAPEVAEGEVDQATTNFLDRWCV